MKKLLSRITIALFLTLYACYPVHVMADGKDKAVYKGHSDNASGLWVLNSKTGEVQFCYAEVKGYKEFLLSGECKIIKLNKEVTQ